MVPLVSKRIGRSACASALLVAFAFAFSFIIPQGASAQNARIVHTITKSKQDIGPAMGRDLWFTMAQNYEDQGGKWYMLYVTSPNNTVVHVESSLGTKVLPVQAYQVASFEIPLGWEVKTSGIVENKGIRVYSNDADITAYLMSHNPYTTDGMYIVPPMGWGNDYVVAAYESLFELTFDYPSEFSVVANQNNTEIDVTPTQDIRGTSPTQVLHPGGQEFSDMLQRGQCIQYQLVQAQNAEDYDVTGTIVHSNNPVGVVGASQCPNIPVDYPYCDHVCDMLPPIRTWATTYYSAPFADRTGGDTFLIIGSKPGQTIYYASAAFPRKVYCILGKQYDHFWRDDVMDACRWESDAPFMLVQYANSSTFPDNGSLGDPAMVVINSVQQFTKRVVFMTPVSSGSHQSDYINFTNVVVPTAAANTTYFDGKRITLWPRLPVDGVYDVYRVNNVQAGAHNVVSDSGIGVYIYGYGDYESYAWAGNLGTRTFDSPDTIPPVAITSGQCFQAHVSLSDVHPLASKLGLVRVDTSYNMAFKLDPNWIEGAGMDSTYYDMYVLDNSQPAELIVTAADIAGNLTKIQSVYNPQVATLSPPVQNFGTGSTSGPAVVMYDTIINTGVTNYTFTDLKLIRGNVGFSIDSADLAPLVPGEKRLIKIGFIPNSSSTVGDTVYLSDGCLQQQVVLIGSGGQPDFYVTDFDWGARLVNTSTLAPSAATKLGGVLVVNPSNQKLSIDSVQIDSAQFVLAPTVVLPFVINANSSYSVPIIFTPNYAGTQIVSAGHFFGSSGDSSLGQRQDKLKGIGIAPAQIFESDTNISLSCTLGDTLKLDFYIQATGTYQTTIGKLVHTEAGNPMWPVLSATDQANRPLDPNTAPVGLSNGMKLLVYLDFIPPTKTAGVYTDSVTAYALDDSGALVPIKTIYASVTVHYSELSVVNPVEDFGTVTYANPVTAPRQLTYKNTGPEDVTVNKVVMEPASKNPLAFNLTGTYDVNGIAATLPATVHPGETFTADVTFDPGKYTDISQSADFALLGTNCNLIPSIETDGKIDANGASLLGYSSDPILACAQEVNNVTVHNGQPSGIADTILAASISGADAAHFTIPSIVGKTIDGTQNLTVPVTFSPLAQPGSTTYTATLTVTVHSQFRDTTMTLLLTGTGVSITASTSAIMASKSDAAGDHVALPLDVSTDMHGLTAPLESMKINEVRFDFTLNTDLLQIEGSKQNDAATTAAAIAQSLTNIPSPWVLDEGNSSYGNGHLVLAFKNPSGYMAASLTSFGDLNFKVMLPGSDTERDVTLNSMQLFTDDGNGGSTPAPAGCISTSVASSDFSLIYNCGDKLLQSLMNGNNSISQIVKDPTPNPSTNRVTFTYACRVEQPLTISVYDVLGHEVATGC